MNVRYCTCYITQAVLWDFKAHTSLHKLEGHNHDVCSCNFSPDGSLVATASYDTSVLIWDSLEGTCLKQLRCVSNCYA